MINYVVGKIKEIKEQCLTILVNGIGLAIFIPRTNNLERNKSVELYTYMHWNTENGPSLYGFTDELEKIIFLMIIDCPKIGPKIALNILSQITPNEFLDIISTQNEKRLSSINGIGEKKAEAIIMQLKHKVTKLIAAGTISTKQESSFSNFQTLNDALLSLGYTKQEITKVIQNLAKESEVLAFDQLMRKALFFLSKGA